MYLELYGLVCALQDGLKRSSYSIGFQYVWILPEIFTHIFLVFLLVTFLNTPGTKALPLATAMRSPGCSPSQND
jgi:hypothetical protein